LDFEEAVKKRKKKIKISHERKMKTEERNNGRKGSSR
jgi:hypothetical protein